MIIGTFRNCSILSIFCVEILRETIWDIHEPVVAVELFQV